jgi:hypothetical protein
MLLFGLNSVLALLLSIWSFRSVDCAPMRDMESAAETMSPGYDFMNAPQTNSNGMLTHKASLPKMEDEMDQTMEQIMNPPSFSSLQGLNDPISNAFLPSAQLQTHSRVPPRVLLAVMSAPKNFDNRKWV